jgi:hypothetical protein
MGVSGNVIEMRRKARPDSESWVRRALFQARQELVNMNGTEPSEVEMNSQLLRLLVRVDLCAPRVGQARVNGCMPDIVHSIEERAEAAKQRMIDYTAGDAIDKPSATAEEVSAAEAIEDVFRRHLVGKNPGRDFQILFDLARKETDSRAGHQTEQRGSVRNVARKYHISPALVRKRRDVQMSAIADGIRHLYPKPAPSTGVIWGERRAA